MDTVIPMISNGTVHWSRSRASRSIAAVLAELLLGVLIRAGVFVHKEAQFEESLRSFVRRHPGRSYRTVLFLSVHDCTNYLWFAMLLRRKLPPDDFASPVIVVVSEPGWLKERTPDALSVFIDAGFVVLPMKRPRRMPGIPSRIVTSPTLLLLDRKGTQLAEYSIRPSVRDMYGVVAAVLALSRYSS